MPLRTPRVTIGLPVYNGENFLRLTLTSLLAQTYRDFEMVISDNASADATERICGEFAARDRRIRYCRATENRGAIWNYNRVFDLSRGEYFMWASHDDLWATTFLEKCVAALDDDRRRVLALPRVVIIDQHGCEIIADDARRNNDYEVMTDEAFSGRRENLEHDSPSRRFFGVLVQTIRCQEIYGLIRTDALQRTGLHRPFANSEKALIAELALLGKIHEVPERLYFSRWHDARYSNSHDANEKHEHFITGGRKRRFVWPHQPRCLAGYATVAAKAPISPLEKLRCAMILARFVAQPGRIGSVIRRMLRGTGMTVDIPDHAATGQSVAAITGVGPLAHTT